MQDTQFAALLAQFTRIADALEQLAGNQADGLVNHLFQNAPVEVTEPAAAPRSMGDKTGAQLALPMAVPRRGPIGMSFEAYRKKALGDHMLTEQAAARIAELAGVQPGDLFQPVDYAPAAAWLPFFSLAKRLGLEFGAAEVIMSDAQDVEHAIAILSSREALRLRVEAKV